jgi:putative spermidine/putrescine transport system ATP-binding protein
VHSLGSPGAALKLRGLTKSYGPERVVDDVSLDVRPGEFLTLLGPSGSGKTTTLNLVAGFVRPDAGEISIDGATVSKLPPHRRDIGVVFQHYALFPHMTVAENVAFSLRERKVRRADALRRAGEALELVQLGALASRYPSQLSGGQQQRVAVARAVVFEPRLLLMDEPLGALDRKLRETLQVELRRLHRELGITFVYVTHDQDEAMGLSGRIAVFRRGRVEQLGTPDELYERPESRFVAEFLGESNVFCGTVRGSSAVETPSGLIAITSAGGLGDGDPCAVVVRPEAMRVVEQARATATSDNELHGTLLERVYLGSSAKVTVVLEQGGAVTVRRPTRDVQHLGTGQGVIVRWSREDSVVVPADEGELSAVPGGAGHLAAPDKSVAGIGWC